MFIWIWIPQDITNDHVGRLPCKCITQDMLHSINWIILFVSSTPINASQHSVHQVFVGTSRFEQPFMNMVTFPTWNRDISKRIYCLTVLVFICHCDGNVNAWMVVKLAEKTNFESANISTFYTCIAYYSNQHTNYLSFNATFSPA